jgi:hypothetical protein
LRSEARDPVHENLADRDAVHFQRAHCIAPLFHGQ